MTTTVTTNLTPTEYEPSPLTSSVVSYPARCPLWGDRRFHGNCDGRLFKSLLEHYRPKYVADPMQGSGTTRDVVRGLNKYCKAGICFWGSDLATGFDLATDFLPGRFDLIWVHPPYWNIVRYSDNAADLSTCDDYALFLERLTACLQRCASSLNPGGRLAVLVGDVRRRGMYYPLGRDVMCMKDLGQLVSVIVKAQHHCRSDGKEYGAMPETPIRHELCAVFKNVTVEPGRATR